MTEKIYSTQAVENKGNRVVHNPVHFVAPEEGVTKVYVQDGYPAVNNAYEAAGVEVKPLSELPGQKAAAAPAEKKETK